MTSTVDSCECESVVLFDVACGFSLAMDEVGSVFFKHGSIHRLDPVVSTNGRNCAIDVSGEVKHSVFALEALVDPLGTNRKHGVVKGVLIRVAHVPCLIIAWDVQSVSHFLTVEVFKDGIAIDAGRKLSKSLLQPRSVV